MKMSTPAGGGDGLDKMDKSIVFNASKNEKFKVNDNYRIFQRKTKAAYSNVMVNKDMITPELLRAASLFICTGEFFSASYVSLSTSPNEGDCFGLTFGFGYKFYEWMPFALNLCYIFSKGNSA
jgi:hypothetical protein